MALIRAFLNNGFFILILIVAVTLYLAYSDSVKRDHGLLDESSVENTTAHTDEQATPDAETMNSAAETEISTPAPEIAKADEAEVTIPSKEAETPVASEEATAEAEPSVVITSTNQTAEESIAAPVVETTAENPTTVKPVIESTPAEEAPSAVPEPVIATTADATKTAATTSKLPPYDEKALEAILNDETLTEDVPEFASTAEAYQAARNAFYQKDYVLAEKIYLSMFLKNPSANIAGEMGNVLYADGKQDWANRAWMESAKLLIKENRLREAHIFANRLHAVSPDVARKIGYQISKIMAAKQAQQMNRPAYPATQQPAPTRMAPMRPPAQYQPQPLPPHVEAMRKAQQERHQAMMEEMKKRQQSMPMPQPGQAQSMPPMTPPAQFKPEPMPEHIEAMRKAQQERYQAMMAEMQKRQQAMQTQMQQRQMTQQQ